MTKCRDDYIGWDEYFMGIAHLSARRSKDPSTQVGTCIVSRDNRILSVGYNGLPNGMDDKSFDWGRSGGFVDSKYAYVIHAEPNAILNFKGSARELEGASLYVTLFPCNECAKLIIQSGIKKVFYADDKYHDSEQAAVARRLFDACRVEYIKFKTEGDKS